MAKAEFFINFAEKPLLKGDMVEVKFSINS